MIFFFFSSFKILFKDTNQIVRETAASRLAEFAKSLEYQFITSEIIFLWNQLVYDDYESVRLISLKKCISIASLLSCEDIKQHMIPVLRHTTEDKSSKISYVASTKLMQIKSCFLEQKRLIYR